jgi:hypothetical protein
MTDLAIWFVRMIVVFGAVATFPFSKRISLVIFASAIVDFFAVLIMIVTGPALLFHAGWLFLFGLLIGFPNSIGVDRLVVSDQCKTALAVLLLLKLPYLFDRGALSDLAKAWPSHLVCIIVFPLGLLAGAEAVSTWRRFQTRQKRHFTVQPITVHRGGHLAGTIHAATSAG